MQYKDFARIGVLATLIYRVQLHLGNNWLHLQFNKIVLRFLKCFAKRVICLLSLSIRDR